MLVVMYLDANATTPMADEVLDAMLPWLREHFHNPSSSHRGGKQARAAIEAAREQVAHFLSVRADEIVFTSGGTEAINALLQSWDASDLAGHFLTSKVEHSAVLRTGERMARGEPVVHRRDHVARRREPPPVRWELRAVACAP